MSATLNIDPERIYTVREVAELFHTTDKAVRGWISSGKLSPMPTIGAAKRFSGQEIMAALAVNGYGSCIPQPVTTGAADLEELRNIR